MCFNGKYSNILIHWYHDIISSHKKDGSFGIHNSNSPDTQVEWRRTFMKSQIENMLEIDGGGVV